MKMIKPIVNFAKIADSFDTFIFGYNGVISYGNGIIPSAAECLKNLAAMRKKIVIISNSNLRTLEIVEQLSTAGISPAIFSNIVTAGEILHYRLKFPSGNYHALGKLYYQIGAVPYSGIMSGLPLQRVASLEKAHFLFMAQTQNPTDTIDNYRADLEQAVSYGLPFVCAGNDTSCFENGKPVIAPGAVAEAYAVLGGRVITMGKPDLGILNYALEGIADLGKIVIIGDNISTDIKMASLAKIPSILISKGRHINYLGEGYIPDVAKTRELANSFDVEPEGVISEVRW